MSNINDEFGRAEKAVAPEMSAEEKKIYELTKLLEHLITPPLGLRRAKFLSQLADAEERKIQTEREHQHQKARMLISPETIETVKNQLELKKAPTAKQVEAYIRLETRDLEIKRYDAKLGYKTLRRVYELIQKE